MKKLFLRAKKSVLSKLSLWLEQTDYSVRESIFAINEKIRTSDVEEELEKLRTEAETIINKAEEYRQAPGFMDEEKDLVYYYFLLKHYIAEYESYFDIVPPVQVFNEHRMTLDHFIRAKRAVHEKNREEDMNKATDHMLRGLLDILKLNCAGLRTKIVKRHAYIPHKVLGGVSNGEYIKEFIKLQNIAEDSINAAKRSDYIQNGDDKKINLANKFIYAYIAHNRWYRFQFEHKGEVFFQYAWYYLIKGGTVVVSFLTGIAAGLAANHFSDILAFLKGFFAPVRSILAACGFAPLNI
jgi:hypothetical protein